MGTIAERWLLEFETGYCISLRAGVTVLGRGSSCDVVLDDPAISRRQLLLLPRAEGVEVVNVGRQVASVDGQAIDAPTLARAGGRLSIAGAPLGTILVQGSDPSQEASTVLGPRGEASPAGLSLRLERYARGGLLTLSEADEQRSVYLAPLRFSLVHALLVPSPPASPGDFVSVRELCRQIWPDDLHKDDNDFGVLLHRLRQDLQRADLDPKRLVERARGTGMIRAPLASEATIISE
ncbi:FHA domain-containing protein [Pseudenhygromyxa sp. WMMC2535]|uniref:FHA domain-containing protein n=1 Tax=Pseudenhygromyxa sp. WMMC2535 TaxID=2712867 RepID=UPI00155259FE|nr:FHA domain-containing protein [Pseudenhygromyxa sp. WMMC2535]